MSSPIIKVENISKQYRLGNVGTGTLSHDFNRWWHKVRGKEDPYLQVGEINDRTQRGGSDYVWALKDINFEVKPGEILGIIGKNGAGKSTLLKLLSRVTAPTTGKITCHGSIASLLEVGTGFHPELTGQENVFLNGALLGMTKKEIKAKLSEITDFAGCAKYMDTPVKRYSSGMRVRLGFAVAAFLEPDILVVDEVLAVGDAEFQKKAIGKMKNISSGEGRTVLFVSHNMASVKSLCSRAIVLENGEVAFKGDTDECIDFYLKMENIKGSNELRHFDESEFKDLEFQIHSVGVKAEQKDYGKPLLRTDNLLFIVEYSVKRDDFYVPVFRFKDEQGNFIFVTDAKEKLCNRNSKNKIALKIPSNFFNQGNFFVDIQITDNRKMYFRAEDAITFTIIQESVELGKWMGRSPGPLRPHFNWINL